MEPSFGSVDTTLRIMGLSLSGAKVDTGRTDRDPHWIELQIPGIAGPLAGPVVRSHGSIHIVAFGPLRDTVRDSLIAFLFSGQFGSGGYRSKKAARIWRNLWQRFSGASVA